MGDTSISEMSRLPESWERTASTARSPATHNTSRLEDLLDLVVDPLKVGSVHGGLDGIDGVKAVGPKVLCELHKVGLDKVDLVREARSRSVLCCALHLELVVVEARDVRPAEPRNLARGPAHAAPDVEHLHSRLEAHLSGEVVLVACNGLVEGLALVVPASGDCPSRMISALALIGDNARSSPREARSGAAHLAKWKLVPQPYS